MFFLAPFLIGSLFYGNFRAEHFKKPAYRFVAGVMTMMAIWAAMTLGFTIVLPTNPFHQLRYAYIIVIMVFSIISLIHEKLIISRIRTKQGVADLLKVLARQSKGYVIVFTSIVIMQLVNTAYYAPVGYVTDDLSYFPLVNDAVYMDQLYAKVQFSGAIPSTGSKCLSEIVGAKVFVAPWYSYLAFISATLHVHPIVVCRTVMPVYLIILTYITAWVLGDYLLDGDRAKTIIFMACTAFLIEAFSYTYYLFHLLVYVSSWGKIPAAIIGMPMLYLTISAVSQNKSVTNKEQIQYCFLLFMLGTATGMMAATVMIMCSIGLFLLMITHFIIVKKKVIVLYVLSAELPLMLQFIIWLAVNGIHKLF